MSAIIGLNLQSKSHCTLPPSLEPPLLDALLPSGVLLPSPESEGQPVIHVFDDLMEHLDMMPLDDAVCEIAS